MFNLLAQAADSYDYTTTTTSSGGSAAGGIVIIIIYLAIIVLMLASMWKLFQKAGRPGWASIVPVYNTYVMFQIAGKPGWWTVLAFIPLVNIVVLVLAYIELSKRFGQGGGFAALLILLPFVGFPILAFGNSKYNTAAGDINGGQGPQPPAGSFGSGTPAGVSDAAPANTTPDTSAAGSTQEPYSTRSSDVAQPQPNQTPQQPGQFGSTPPTPAVPTPPAGTNGINGNGQPPLVQ